MDIKPTGPGAVPQPAEEAVPSVGEKQSSVAFHDLANSSTVPGDQPFEAVVSQFRRPDLQDPEKVEKMLWSCASELLTSAVDRTSAPVSHGGRAYLTDFLQNDPYLRGKLLNYLERILT